MRSFWQRPLLLSSILVLLLSTALSGKDSPPGIVLYWPNAETPSLKVTFSVFRQLGSFGGKLTLLSDVVVQNLSGKLIPHASFTVYMLDKDKVRIGNGVLVFDDLAPDQAAKVLFQCETVGAPSTLALLAHKDAQGIPNSMKVVPLKIISVPEGAKLKVDGQDDGITPAVVNLSVGTHTVELSKEGFTTATSPLEIKPDEMAGGSITIELGGLSQDTLELRDGTVVTGDLISLSLKDVDFRLDGKDIKYDRNLVKKIMLVERVTTQQPPVVQPVSQQAK